jgi:ABC-2 type transport system ATP-binding protein
MTSVIVQTQGDDVARLAREPGVRVEKLSLEDLYMEVMSEVAQ